MSYLSKIALLTLEYPPQVGGVSRYYAGLVQYWPENIIVKHLRLSWLLWPHWLPWFWQVWRLVKKEKIEMLWVGQVLPVGYVALWFKRRKKIPYAVFTHGMDILAPQKSRWKKHWLKKILAAAELVVANSQFTRGELVKLGVEEERIMVVYPCPSKVPIVCHSERSEESLILREQKDPSALRPQDDICGNWIPGQARNDTEKIILSVGRLVKRKGFDKMIEIMPRILKRASDARYVIIGQGPEAVALKAKAAELGLLDCVEILENISDEELREWYNKCVVFALPCCQIGADVEGFGLVFLEAALAGKPVVAGKSGGASEAVRHGYGGFVVDTEASEELYQALLKILTDEPFAHRLGAYGQEWVSRNFQWEKEIEKLEEAVAEMTEKTMIKKSSPVAVSGRWGVGGRG